MCLIIDKKQCPKEYKIAKKNIPCYKVLLKTHLGRFRTPFIEQNIDIKTGIEADYFQTNPDEYDRIVKGVHSCTNLERAYIVQDTYLYSLNVYRYVGTVVLKAYIPKGTKYWVGKGHEFCSERIVFAEKQPYSIF